MGLFNKYTLMECPNCGNTYKIKQIVYLTTPYAERPTHQLFKCVKCGSMTRKAKKQ